VRRRFTGDEPARGAESIAGPEMREKGWVALGRHELKTPARATGRCRPEETGEGIVDDAERGNLAVGFATAFAPGVIGGDPRRLWIMETNHEC